MGGNLSGIWSALVTVAGGGTDVALADPGDGYAYKIYGLNVSVVTAGAGDSFSLQDVTGRVMQVVPGDLTGIYEIDFGNSGSELTTHASEALNAVQTGTTAVYKLRVKYRKVTA